MTITCVELIEDALQLIGVVGESQSVSAEQGSTGLNRLNQLMEMLAAEDISVGYFAQTSTTADCPLPAWAERGITSRLAMDLLTLYPSAQGSGELLDDERNGFGVIRRICLLQKMKPSDMSHLGLGEGGRASIDITRGY